MICHAHDVRPTPWTRIDFLVRVSALTTLLLTDLAIGAHAAKEGGSGGGTRGGRQKSESEEENAGVFQRSTRKLKCSLWGKNAKRTIAVIVVLVLVLLLP